MLQDLKAFEHQADKAAKDLSIFGLPARTVLAGLHYAVFIGSQYSHWDGDEDAGIGTALVQRASEALPLLRELNARPVASAGEAMAAFQNADPDGLSHWRRTAS